MGPTDARKPPPIGLHDAAALSAHFPRPPTWQDSRMIPRKHLRIVRAVQRVVAAAKELTDAERALQDRPAKGKQAARQTDANGEGPDGPGGA